MSETIDPVATEPPQVTEEIPSGRAGDTIVVSPQSSEEVLTAVGSATPSTIAPGSGGQADTPTQAPPALDMLADAPLTTDENDRLNFTAYANALAGVLDNPSTDTPLTIAISAPWGAGKTSLANMVTSRLVNRPLERGDRPHIVCWFNAWLHDDAPHLGAAFAAEVAKTANRHRVWPRRFLSPLASAMLSPEQRWRRRIFIGLLSLAVAVAIAVLPKVRAATKPGATTVSAIQAVVGQRWAPLILLALLIWVVWRKVFAAAQATARFVDDPKSEAAAGSMQQVHEQLGKLIRQATRNPGPFGEWIKHVWPAATKLFPRLRGRRRLVLIVDDLERCRPPRGVEVCEVASQLLGHPDVMTILVADMSTVAASAEIKYSQLETLSSQSKKNSPSPLPPKGTYGRHYLQKMVQLQFDLPPENLASVSSILAAGINTAAKSQNDDTSHDSEENKPSRKSRPRRIFDVKALMTLSTSVAVTTVLATTVTALITFYLDRSRSTSSSTAHSTSLWSIVGILAAITTLLFALIPLILNRRRQRAQRIDEKIRSLSTETDDVDSLKAAVLGSNATDQGLAGQRFAQFIADDWILRQQAESEAVKFLPRVPRSAKRLVNHLRLLLVVASERKMLGGKPPLEATHLGKWAVLLERWPELGFAIRADPARLADIEKTAHDNPQALTELIQSFSPTATDLPDTIEFFKSEPALAAVIQRLIYCLPAADATGELNRRPTTTTGVLVCRFRTRD
jgi:KAP family P-loop domain